VVVMGYIVVIALLMYAYWTVMQMVKLAVDMSFALIYYRESKRRTMFKYSHEGSYWDVLMWVRSL
jgi:hypothetical protein